MFMKKKISGLLLTATILVSSVPGNAQTIEEKARVLYDLGLLKGTESTFSLDSLQLDRNATRAEMCTTVVRMLGKEKKAEYQNNAHPFNDVPTWASANIGWLYENYLVNGVSDTYFGAKDIATVKQFSTMLLRVLGYDDSQGDFYYEDAVNFGRNLNLIDTDTAMHYELSRSDMISMCYNALTAKIKNSDRFLSKKLCDEKAMDANLASSLGVLQGKSLSDAFGDVDENLGYINVYDQGGMYCIHFEDYPVEHYGLRVYIQPEGGMFTEVKPYGDIQFEKGEIQYLGGGAAGYVSDLYLYGLDYDKTYSVIVVKTTSEGDSYLTVGKSTVAYTY